jgi:hypothetical protein
MKKLVSAHKAAVKYTLKQATTMGDTVNIGRNALVFHAQGPHPSQDIADRNVYLPILMKYGSDRNG